MPATKDPQTKLIDAAMELAASGRWHDVTMIDIATAANTDIAIAFDHFKSKADILRQFVRKIDRLVLADLDPAEFNEPGHDRLIAVMMARFDALAPYRPALKSIIADHGDLGPADALRAIKTHFGSMRWMLDAAGFTTGGLHGSLRIAGLGTIYARGFSQWLDDETTDFGPTMAALDRALARGSNWDKRIHTGILRFNNLRGKVQSKCSGLAQKYRPTTHTETAPDSTKNPDISS
ncbi:TetR family transcriptional regulator [Thalassospira alkalitolerans]|uniref:TetR family transcriptional regulator n=1 Tax=Thalassospira alkalitolerans TaxID=1293890 RepID=UPI003AA9C309